MFFRFLKVLFLCASNNLLIGMSLDRFIAIKWPMKFVRIGEYHNINPLVTIGFFFIFISFFDEVYVSKQKSSKWGGVSSEAILFGHVQ